MIEITYAEVYYPDGKSWAFFIGKKLWNEKYTITRISEDENNLLLFGIKKDGEEERLIYKSFGLPYEIWCVSRSDVNG